jgi:uncharacterized protein
MSQLHETVATKRDRLLEAMAGYGSCAIAYSGGVDSAVVAKAAQIVLGDAAVAVTGVSASLAEGELVESQRVAQLIGVRHQVLRTREFDNPAYIANLSDRCYHCKTELYGKLQGLAEQLGLAVLVDGTNADDLHDCREGIQAASQFGVRSPLAECGLTKQEVRELAADWQLPVADKPATPCLSSRISYGEEITPERLRMVDAAEQVLRSFGITPLRVRYHAGDIARIEVPVDEIGNCSDQIIRTTLTEELHALGFKFITLDLEGFRSGSMMRLVEADAGGDALEQCSRMM